MFALQTLDEIGRRSANTIFWMEHNRKEAKMRSSFNFIDCLSWDSNSHLLATDARHQLNKKRGHSSEEDRQNYSLKPMKDTNFLVQPYWQIVTAPALQFIGEK